MDKLRVFEGGIAKNEGPVQILSDVNFDLSGNKYETMRGQIDTFMAFKKNWDGYGAIAVLGEVGEMGKQFLSMLSSTLVDKIMDIFPNPHGTITIEWENAAAEKVSLELGMNNYSYFVKLNGEDPRFFDGKNIFSDFKDFNHELGKLFSSEIPKFFL